MRKREQAETLITMTLLDELIEEYRQSVYRDWVSGSEDTRGRALAAEELLGFVKNRAREIIRGE